MTPQEVAAQVERLDQDFAELRKELAVDRAAFLRSAINVGVLNLSFSLWLWLLAMANRTNEEFFWICVMSANVTLLIGLSILFVLAGTWRVRRAWLRSGKGKVSIWGEPLPPPPITRPIEGPGSTPLSAGGTYGWDPVSKSWHS
jgi:hypothetical protein